MLANRREVAKLVLAGVTIGASISQAVVRSGAQTKRVRLPLHEFVASDRMLRGLRRGVAAMQKRKASDPLSWFYQAAIHGVTDQLWCEEGRKDPDVYKVNRAKYWNQCPHFGQNSANFLPWHRAYTHHFEEILRMHTEEDDFAIPYWDYSLTTNRTFPREFGIEHLDGNPKNDDPANINPLFHAQRDFFLCGYEHPFTDQLPLTELSARAVDATRVMNSNVFFGETESTGVGGGVYDGDGGTRGLLEQSPHDQIHRAVGGRVIGTDGNGNQTVAIGSMAIPMTAGFDPIFPVHHANIDRLWMKWACMPGKSWGTIPDKAWFDEKPWFFFDVKGNEVNRPRKDYFDYRALGVSFKDEDPQCVPLELPSAVLTGAPMAAVERTPVIRIATSHGLHIAARVQAPTTRTTTVSLLAAPGASASVVQNFRTMLSTADPGTEAVTLTLHDVDIADLTATGFDVFLIAEGQAPPSLTPESPNYVGAINLFGHSDRFDQTFDVTGVVASLKAQAPAGLNLVLVPYLLATDPKRGGPPISLRAGALKVDRISLQKGDKSIVRGNPPHRH